MHCTVIGSGATGLTAALLLARLGHRVTVVEALPRPAPLLQGFVRHGLYFETGFHCGGGLHPGGVLRQWLDALGLFDGANALSDMCLGNSDRFFFADGSQAVLPSGIDAVADGMERQFPGSGSAMRTFMDATLEVLAHSPYLDAHLAGAPQPLVPSGKELTEQLEKSGLPATVRVMIASRCMLYGVLPEEASFDGFALVAGPYFQSSGSWQGGGRALATALLARLHNLGVEVLCGQAVTAIEADSGGVRGIQLGDGRHIACEHCFFTGHPAQLGELLPQGLLRPAYIHRIEDMPESIYALLLFAEVREGLQSGESIYLLPEPDAPELFPTLDADNPAVYIFCDRPQPDGRKAVMAVAHLAENALPPEGEDAYAAWKQEQTRRLQHHIEQRLPHLAGNWRVLDAATPRTMRRYAHGAKGGLYGLRHTANTMPLLPMTRVERLFLTGQHVLLPGILGAIVSAALAVGFAFGHDAVLKEFRQCAHNE